VAEQAAERQDEEQREEEGVATGRDEDQDGQQKPE
jgi:hypothetical protein